MYFIHKDKMYFYYTMPIIIIVLLSHMTLSYQLSQYNTFKILHKGCNEAKD